MKKQPGPRRRENVSQQQAGDSPITAGKITVARPIFANRLEKKSCFW
jgi:hypothetical protein